MVFRKWLHVFLWLVTIHFFQRFCGHISPFLTLNCILSDQEKCCSFVETFSVGQNGFRPLFSYYARHHGVFWHFMLLLCGDVSLNPGPFKYLYTICRRWVRSNLCALQCDRCQLWSHITYVCVDHDFYAELQDKSEISWLCLSCLFSVLPSFDVCDDLQSVIASVQIVTMILRSPQMT